MKTGMYLAAAVLCGASIVPIVAGAEPWEVRREIREGARSVAIEKREAAREVNRCKTRDCVSREMREGQREVDRERREARNEVRQARAENYSGVARYDGRYYGNGQYGNGSTATASTATASTTATVGTATVSTTSPTTGMGTTIQMVITVATAATSCICAMPITVATDAGTGTEGTGMSTTT